MNDKLTGKIRYRSTLMGKLVLQVEIEYQGFTYPDDTYTKSYWRDATTKDVVLIPNGVMGTK